MNENEFKIKPIGYVRIEGDNPMTAKYFIDIQEQYRSALKQLDKFSHVQVIWWAHQNDTKEIRCQTAWVITPPYGECAPETGIFATRAEYRPNPIALTTTGILEINVEQGIVKIPRIDAFDGTPVLDLKAYFPICDRVRDCYIAPWLKEWPEWVEEGIEWWQEQGFFDDYIEE